MGSEPRLLETTGVGSTSRLPSSRLARALLSQTEALLSLPSVAAWWLQVNISGPPLLRRRNNFLLPRLLRDLPLPAPPPPPFEARRSSEISAGTEPRREFRKIGARPPHHSAARSRCYCYQYCYCYCCCCCSVGNSLDRLEIDMVCC